MKYLCGFVSLCAVALVAGCGTAPATPSYVLDSSLYANPPSSSIPRAPSSSFVPAPPAPVEVVPADTSDETSVSKPTTNVARPLSPTSTVGTVNVQKLTPSPESYSKALNTYKTRGAYFQLVLCRGTPGSISLKQGVKFMLDNRDKIQHVLRVGENRYQVAPYGFVVVPAPTTGRYYITCDGGGSAFLNVEE